MIDIEYKNNGRPSNDFTDGRIVDEIINSEKKQGYYVTSSFTFIMLIRFAVCQKRINCDDIMFIFNDKKIRIDQNGCFLDELPKEYKIQENILHYVFNLIN